MNRLTGIVISASSAYGFIKSGDQEYFVHRSNYPLDTLGRRWLNKGEQVEFEPVPPAERHGKTAKEMASDIRVLSQRAEEDIKTYREQGQVHKLIAGRDDYCFIARPFGSLAFLHRNGIAAASPEVSFQVGQWWDYSVTPTPSGNGRGKSWRAVEAVWIEEPGKEIAA